LLLLKADITYVDSGFENISSLLTIERQARIQGDADTLNASKAYTDLRLGDVDFSNFYTRNDVDSLLLLKADITFVNTQILVETNNRNAAVGNLQNQINLLPDKVYVDGQDQYILNAANAYTNIKFNTIDLNLFYTKLEVDYLLASKANESEVVKLTGNQTIAGVKTFTSSPIVPTPTTNNQASNKQYVDGFNTDETIILLATKWVGNNYILSRSVIDETKFMFGLPTPTTSNNVANIADAMLFITQLNPNVVISCVNRPIVDLVLVFRGLN